jgi:hypothetical protein
VLLQVQGELSLAEPFLRRALEGRERTLGRDHPDTILSVNITRESVEDYGKGKVRGREALMVKGNLVFEDERRSRRSSMRSKRRSRRNNSRTRKRRPWRERGR